MRPSLTQHSSRLLKQLVSAAAAALTGATAARRTARAMDSLPAHHLSLNPTSWWPFAATAARFTNPWPTWTGDKQLRDLMKFSSEMRALGAPNWGWLSDNRKPTLEECSRAFPISPPDAAALADPPADAIQALWVGHATVLVQMEGVCFITDPVFSQRASPVQFMGPQRAVQPALTPDDPAFPSQLDFVLLSHNHYDHLCSTSVDMLAARYPGLHWYVPLGLKRWFSSRGIHTVTELDWWEEVQHSGSKVRVMLTPAQHWSARGAFDRRSTLWGGWAVLGQQLRFWFAGDTGYCSVFKEIGERLGPFDLAAIPIGAYEPRWFMEPMHTNPSDAVAIHQEVRSKKSIGIHCCTFALTTEPLDEPPKLLQQEAAKAGLPPGAFVTLQHGAMLQTADGQDRNAPALLPLPATAAAAEVSAAAAAESSQ